MKKKILIILLLLLLIAAGALIYLNAVFLPAKIKSIIISSLENQLNCQVSLESLSYHFFKGVEIDNLAIYAKKEDIADPLITIKKVSFKLLYLPILKSDAIVIPGLKLESPNINIIRSQDNVWNFSDLRFNPPSKSDFDFFVYQINVAGAQIYFSDQTTSPAFSYTVPQLNARAHLALPNNISFKLETKLSKENVGSLLIVNGSFDIKNKSLSAAVNSRNIDLLQFRPYYNLPFEASSLLAKEADFDIHGQEGKISVSGRLLAENISLAEPPYSFSGDCLISPRIELNLAEPRNTSISGSAQISRASLKGIPILKDIAAIKGTLIFNPAGIKTDDLQGIARGIAITAIGEISNFPNPSLELKLFSFPTLQKLSEIFSSQLQRFDFEVKGNTQLVLDITGLFNQPESWNFKGACKVIETNLAIPQLARPLKDINGDFEFDRNSLGWKNLSLDYSGVTYASNGRLTNFAQPHLALNLGSKLLSLSSDLDIREKILAINRVSGKYLNSAFVLKGTAGLDNPDNPLLDLTGNLEINLPDLAQIFPNYKIKLERVKPTGTLGVDLSLQGKLKNRRQWNLNAFGRSKEITLKGLRLNELRLACFQQNEEIKDFTIAANAYGGMVSVSANARLFEEDIPFKLITEIRDVDLGQLKQDTQWKEEPTAGKLSLFAQLQGLLKDVENIRGSGSLILTEGNLWELNLLKGLGNFLFIPEFRKIIFKEATADFLVEKSAVYTDNLMAKSDEMNLTCQGAVDFSGKLNFTVTALINQELVQNSSSLKKFITSILTSASGAIVLRVSGTTQKPKYTIIPAPVDIIKRAKEFFFEDILR